MPAPTTPSRTAAAPPNGQGTPGSWKHPKFDEILRRQDARSFSDRRLTQALKNGGALAVSLILSYVFYNSRLYTNLPRNEFFNAVYVIVHWSLNGLRFLFVYNVFDAISGAFRGPDPMVDIPLTADQRSTLSLPPTPSSAAVAPIPAETSQYVTPPRYNKSSPLPSPANRASTPTPSTPNNRPFSNISGISSAKPRVTSTGSPVGPGQNLLTSPGSFRSSSPVFNTPSPLKPIGAGLEKRHSFSSPMNTNGTRQAMIGQGSLVGSMGTNASPSVVASGKWLYEQRNRKRDIF
ncbi:hypothetical protein H072_8560 [Dactylellina haptotyla CBS 200.50]|uniref:Nucleoporin POM34 n=1 Tax=Dactylellina haptotyla (strain CBS 200.50) TaxID=1284197 RepID=S8BR65_DACHA|nr:hypothetical protein H072_8560 [Dactylellina haptotyla CBS 200.50]